MHPDNDYADIRSAGYPANLKAIYRISGLAGYRIPIRLRLIPHIRLGRIPDIRPDYWLNILKSFEM
jgi:hypothetical protein